VQAALRICQRHERSKKQWLRILFLFDPETTWTWLSLPLPLRCELEERADALVFPRRWNLFGIKQRLAQQDKMATEEVCRIVLRATGGWPYLLDVLFDRCGSQDDPRSVAEEIERGRTDSRSELARRFQSTLGLNGIANRILEFVAREGDVPIELISPDLIGDSSLTPLDCDRAVEYLQRMGCVDMQEEQLSVEATVRHIVAQR
jgi:hypothetical protein